MEISSTLAFIAEPEMLEQIDHLINEESMIDDMVTSVDFISDKETGDTYMYRCTNDSDDMWVNVYEVLERLKNKLSDDRVEIIYASTDSKTFVDVVSCTGNFDAYVDSDSSMIQDVCNNYGLPFFDISSDEEDEEETDYDNYYDEDGY